MDISAIHPSPVTSTDRLGLTLVVAVILHAVLILGVSFNIFSSNKKTDRSRTLEVTLVHSSDPTPDNPDYLAQASQRGGGQNSEQRRPSSPVATPLVSSELQQHQQQTMPSSRAQPLHEQRRKMLTTLESEHKLTSRNQKKPRKETSDRDTNARELINRSLAMASLSAEIDQLKQAYAKLPNHKRVAINARQYKYANYVETWRRKVERIGNLNYPEEAVRRKLTGSLEMEVIINADGSINDIIVLRSSGRKTLDDAAIRIVKMAAPFAPFPKDIRTETSTLSITRTWQFLQGNRLYSK